MSTQSDMNDSLVALEADAQALLDQLSENASVDLRSIAIARTNLQQAVMWSKKAIEGVQG